MFQAIFLLIILTVVNKTGLIQVKEEGWTGFSKGWQGCSQDCEVSASV